MAILSNLELLQLIQDQIDEIRGLNRLIQTNNAYLENLKGRDGIVPADRKTYEAGYMLEASKHRQKKEFRCRVLITLRKLLKQQEDSNG